MAQLSDTLKRRWEDHPQQTVRIIVRVADGLGKRAAQIESLGGAVRHRIELTHDLAVCCTADLALRLAQEAWVERIVPDAPVQALGRQSHG